MTRTLGRERVYGIASATLLSSPKELPAIRELIPSRYPSNTWRGFFMRVATIAIAALVLLVIIDSCEYLQSPQPSHTLEPIHPHPESTP